MHDALLARALAPFAPGSRMLRAGSLQSCKGAWKAGLVPPSRPAHARQPQSLAAALKRTRGNSVRAVEGAYEGAGSGGEDYAAVAARLNLLLAKPTLTGKDIRQLVFQKWGKTYDVLLRKQGKRVFLQVMWRFLEQQSFPLSEVEYMQQLDAVAEYITEWGVVDTVRNGIMNASNRGPGYTGGGNAKCISIPLDVDLSSERKGEWS